MYPENEEGNLEGNFGEVPEKEGEGDQPSEEKDDQKEQKTAVVPPLVPEFIKEGKNKLSKYKEEKEKELKTNFDDEVNWNYLFMN